MLQCIFFDGIRNASCSHCRALVNSWGRTASGICQRYQCRAIGNVEYPVSTLHTGSTVKTMNLKYQSGRKQFSQIDLPSPDFYKTRCLTSGFCSIKHHNTLPNGKKCSAVIYVQLIVI